VRTPEDPQELELVRKAILLDVTGCVLWEQKEEERLGSKPPIPELTCHEVSKLLFEYVKTGGEIQQNKENRENWRSKREF
jgi:hypothetical protein